MRKISLLLIIVILTACGSKTSNREENRIFIDNVGFSIQYPKNWKIAKNVNDLVPVAYISNMDDANDVFPENINVTVKKIEKSSLDEFYNQSLEDMKVTHQNLEILEKGENKDIKPKNKWIIYNFNLDGLNMKVIDYYYVTKTHGVIISGNALPNTFDKYRPVFDSIGFSYQKVKK